MTGLVAAACHAWKSELVIDAELHRMDLLVDVRRRAGRERDRPVAEIHEVILELRGPGRRECVFDARSRGPAEACSSVIAPRNLGWWLRGVTPESA